MNSKIKICLVSRKFDKNSGTAEWIYADFLKEKLSKEFDIFTIEQKNIDIFSSRYKKMIYDFFCLPVKLIYMRIVKKIKIFHFLSENQAIFCPFLNLTGAISISMFHDLSRVKYNKSFLDQLYFSFVYKTASKAKVIICNSSSTKNDLEKFLNKKLKNLVIIFPIYRSLKPQKNKKKKKIIIGYLGALVKRKRVLLFYDLAKEIQKKKIKNIEIHIWGKGPEYKKLSSISKKYPILKLKGFAPNDKIEEIYNNFDFFVFPSSYEGLGLPLIEAKMCKVPCFILRDGYFPKEIKNISYMCKNMVGVLNKILNFKKDTKKLPAYLTLEYNLNKLKKLYKNIKK